MLELYQAEGCPHSTKVREAMTKFGLSYVAHNPRVPGGDGRNAHTYEELRTLADADEIPFLVDANRRETVQGSEDIIDYLHDHYA